MTTTTFFLLLSFVRSFVVSSHHIQGMAWLDNNDDDDDFLSGVGLEREREARDRGVVSGRPTFFFFFPPAGRNLTFNARACVVEPFPN